MGQSRPTNGFHHSRTALAELCKHMAVLADQARFLCRELTDTGTQLSAALKECGEATKGLQNDLWEAPPSAPPPASRPGTERAGKPPITYIVDRDVQTRDVTHALLLEDGRAVRAHACSEGFLEFYRPGREGCVLIDADLHEAEALDLLRRLRDGGDPLPVIMVTRKGDVPTAVEALKMGACEIIEKPMYRPVLLAAVARTLEQSRIVNSLNGKRRAAAARIACLTARQSQILQLILDGQPNKNIAADLGISQRTVENHRAAIMKHTGAKSLPALARLALTAGDKAAPLDDEA